MNIPNAMGLGVHQRHKDHFVEIEHGPKSTFLEAWGNDAIHAYEPDVDMDFVWRLLGKKEDHPVSPATKRRVHAIKAKALNLIQPKLTASIHEIAEVTLDRITMANGIGLKSRKLARYMDGAESCVVLAATVGPEIDNAINLMIAKKRLADAYILDALGSGAVESLVARFCQDIEEMLTQVDCIPGLRFSPGYCDWPITEQDKLFSLMQAENIGITLETSGLMQPRKTISATFGIFQEISAKTITNKIPCLHCMKTNCIARRLPSRSTSPPQHSN